jgi:hypothetical protein
LPQKSSSGTLHEVRLKRKIFRIVFLIKFC